MVRFVVYLGCFLVTLIIIVDVLLANEQIGRDNIRLTS